MSIPAMIRDRATSGPTDPAISWQSGTDATTLSWAVFRDRILTVAQGFIALGVGPDADVAILLPNTVEHVLADLAAIHCGAATISIYQTFSDHQIEHVLTDAGPHVLVVADDDTTRRIEGLSWPAKDDCLVIAVHSTGTAMDWAELERLGKCAPGATRTEIDTRIEELQPDRPLTYIYTSGTTGPSKGVPLTGANIAASLESLVGSATLDFDYRSISYLPLAHIVERLWTLYLPARVGGHVVCCPDPGDLVPLMIRFRPSYLFGVPRTFAKLRSGVEAYMSTPELDQVRPEIDRARTVLAEVSRLNRAGETVPTVLAVEAGRARGGVLRSVRERLGLDRVITATCGAAAMPEELHEFWASMGIDVVLGYGMTENSGVVTSDRPGTGAVGSVGAPMPGWEVRIGDHGEILVRGAGNAAGYRNRRDATAELYLDEGWMRTGDLGRLDDAGRLYVTGRAKDLLITSSGKNIAPSSIEDKLTGRSVIDQVMVFGEGRPYVVALITLDPDAVVEFARRHGIVGSATELRGHPTIATEVDRLVRAANPQLSRPEQIKRYRIVDAHWTPLTGELTATMKLRRSVIGKRYGALANALYTDPMHPVSDTSHPNTSEEQ
ncbi:AMP-dependent synthetase/ligase [Gordonia sp. NPDC003376]